MRGFGRDFLDSWLMGESFFVLSRPGWKNAKEPGAYSLTLQKTHYPMPPLCKGRCPAGAEGLSFPASWMYSAIRQSVETVPYNPSVSFAASSRLKGERSEPEGAAKFILRPETPARRSRGWGEKIQGSLWEGVRLPLSDHPSSGGSRLRLGARKPPMSSPLEGGVMGGLEGLRGDMRRSPLVPP